MNNPSVVCALFGKSLLITIPILLLAAAVASAQSSSPPKPSPTPRRALPKPVGGSRGFEQFAGREASSRLIAGSATREPLSAARTAYESGENEYAAARYARAVEQFARATALAPDWISAHNALALSFVETGQLKNAIAEFKQVLKLNASEDLKILSHYNIGNALLDLKQYEDAVSAYQESIKLNSQLSKPHNNLGLSYAALGRLDEAAAEFAEAVRLKPTYAEAHYNLGVTYLQLGQKREADEQLKILAKLNADLAAKLEALMKK